MADFTSSDLNIPRDVVSQFPEGTIIPLEKILICARSPLGVNPGKNRRQLTPCQKERNAKTKHRYYLANQEKFKEKALRWYHRLKKAGVKADV
jgi:hypothetical protein